MRCPRRPFRTHPPPGSALTGAGDDLTARGDEEWYELSTKDAIRVRTQAQTYRMQDRAVFGLTVLLLEVLVLGTLAMVGVALGWYGDSFAIQALAITLTPLFSVWLLVLRWAFRRKGRGDG
jgi:hypothetical protein